MKQIDMIIDEFGNTQIACPYCQRKYEGRVTRSTTYNRKKIRVSCKRCQRKFTTSLIGLKQRTYARKNIVHDELETRVLGSFATIKNLSRTGVRFSYRMRGHVHGHKVGDHILMKIRFPGNKYGEIDYTLEVMNVNDNEYGCRFLNVHSGSRAAKAAGFYLFQVAQKEEEEKDGEENGETGEGIWRGGDR